MILAFFWTWCFLFINLFLNDNFNLTSVKRFWTTGKRRFINVLLLSYINNIIIINYYVVFSRFIWGKQ